MPPAALQWFINYIETFAPAVQREERQQLYATILALQSAPSPTLYDEVGLFVFAQIVAAHQLATPRASGQRPERSSAQATWYEKERQRVSRLLLQIAESPVVASLQATVTYYEAANVTCQHGHNQKTCEALYALRLTLQLLERHPASPWVRKQVERLRQREPHLPPLHALCAPLAPLPDATTEPAAQRYFSGNLVPSRASYHRVPRSMGLNSEPEHREGSGFVFPSEAGSDTVGRTIS